MSMVACGCTGDVVKTSCGRRRVVVTGLGIASAIGLDENSVWQNLLAGRSGIGHLHAFDTTGYRIAIGAEVDDEAVQSRLSGLSRRKVDRALDLALIAASDALGQAGISTGSPDGEVRDVAVIFGSGVGSAQSLHSSFSTFFSKGVRSLRPTAVPRCMFNAISAGLSIHFRLSGANYTVASACSSATNAIGIAFRMIRDGYAESALCGGSDALFDPFFFGVWNNLGALSCNPDPLLACRPFAVDRDGCVLGEGAGALVLEPLERALQSGARIRGEILGYGETSDASHLTQPSAEGQAKAMRHALSDAALEPSAVGLISAHGTATRSNDLCESQSIRTVLGEETGRVPVIANKSYFGHTLGASGALETIVTLLAMEARMVPANLNLESPDPECDIRLVGGACTAITAEVAMKNSFGFGGGNGVLILGRRQQN